MHSYVASAIGCLILLVDELRLVLTVYGLGGALLKANSKGRGCFSHAPTNDF